MNQSIPLPYEIQNFIIVKICIEALLKTYLFSVEALLEQSIHTEPEAKWLRVGGGGWRQKEELATGSISKICQNIEKLDILAIFYDFYRG